VAGTVVEQAAAMIIAATATASMDNHLGRRSILA
jgi:hypothetical protein